jgi:hypothetical protein
MLQHFRTHLSSDLISEIYRILYKSIILPDSLHAEQFCLLSFQIPWIIWRTEGQVMWVRAGCELNFSEHVCYNVDFLAQWSSGQGTNIDDAVSSSWSLDDTSKARKESLCLGRNLLKQEGEFQKDETYVKLKMALFWVVAPCSLVVNF